MLVLLSGGLSNKEIATAAGISDGAVKIYLSAIFEILGVTSRFEAALWALKNMDLLAAGEAAA